MDNPKETIKSPGELIKESIETIFMILKSDPTNGDSVGLNYIDEDAKVESGIIGLQSLSEIVNGIIPLLDRLEVGELMMIQASFMNSDIYPRMMHRNYMPPLLRLFAATSLCVVNKLGINA